MQRRLLEPIVGRCAIATLKRKLLAVCIDMHPIALFEFAREDLNRQWILNQSLNRPLQGAGAVNRIITFVGQQRFGTIADLQ